jgi:hypothetical protein
MPKNKIGRTGRSTRRRSKAVEVTDASKEKEQQKWQGLFCVQLRCGGCHPAASGFFCSRLGSSAGGEEHEEEEKQSFID